MNSCLRRLLKVICGLIATFLLTMVLRHNSRDFRPLPKPLVGGEADDKTSCLIGRGTPRLLHGRWQLHTTNNSRLQISVFSAFFDDREGTKVRPSVRVFAVSNAAKDTKVYCQLWYSQGGVPVVVPADVKSIGRGASYKGAKFMEYLYTCPSVINHSIPHHLSLAFNICDTSTIYVPVIQPKGLIAKNSSQAKSEPHWDHQFAICVAVSYGDINPLRIVEWVEFNKLLGVTEINIYNSSLSKRTMDIFLQYSQEGIVKVHSAPPPVPSWDYWPKKLTVIPGFNDCLYRNMYKYQHVVVTDLDEIILPRLHMNYSSMFANIKKAHATKTSHPSYQFRNTYFFSDLPQDSSKPSYLTTIRQQNRIAPSNPGYSVKTISDPRYCIVLSNHYCLLKMPSPGSQFTLSVKTDFAMNQHYKKCHFTKTECNRVMSKYESDNSTLRFMPQLDKNVLGKLQSLKLI